MRDETANEGVPCEPERSRLMRHRCRSACGSTPAYGSTEGASRRLFAASFGCAQDRLRSRALPIRGFSKMGGSIPHSSRWDCD